MGMHYTFVRENITPATTLDLLTIIAPASKSVVVKRIILSGEGTASAVQRTKVQRSTGGTGGTAIVAEKKSTTLPAAGTTSKHTWTAEPTLSGGPMYSRGWNVFGGGVDLLQDGREIWLHNSEQLSIRPGAGTTGPIDIEVEVEEF